MDISALNPHVHRQPYCNDLNYLSQSPTTLLQSNQSDSYNVGDVDRRYVISCGQFDNNNLSSCRTNTSLGVNGHDDNYERIKTSLSGSSLNRDTHQLAANPYINRVLHDSQESSSMDGIRNQLVRRKTGLGSGHSSNLKPPTVKRCDQQNVALRGWLYRLEGGAIKQWKRRWIVLGDYCLFFYKDVSETKCLGSVLLPSYCVSHCKLSEDGIVRKHSFKLEHQNMKTVFLAADTKESMDQWILVLGLASIMQLTYPKSTPPSSNSAVGPVNGSNDERCIKVDSQDIDTSRLSVRDERKNDPILDANGYRLGDEDEDSGFNSYKSRRENQVQIQQQQHQQQSQVHSIDYANLYLDSGHKYLASYNCIGLPPITSYPAQGYNYRQMIYPLQKSSHYENAPPKPRRQQFINDTNMDLGDIYSSPNNNYFAIPSGAHYHQFMGPSSNGPAPDLIAHNTTSNNYLQSSSLPQNTYNYMVQSNGLQAQYVSASPLSPSSVNNKAHYVVSPHLPPSTTVNSVISPYSLNHREQGLQAARYMQQQPTAQLRQNTMSQPASVNKISARPHSANFLDQEYTNDDEESEGGFKEMRATSNVQENSIYFQRPEPVRNESETIRTHVPKPLPPRPKSSLERYDPYNYNNSIPDNTINNVQENSLYFQRPEQVRTESDTLQNNLPKPLPPRPKSSLERHDPYNFKNPSTVDANTAQSPPQLTSPPARPWSDYLQEQPHRSLQSVYHPTVGQYSPPSMHQSQPSTNQKGYPLSTTDKSQFTGDDLLFNERDTTMQRLMEWKQKMLTISLNDKRPLNGKEGSSSLSASLHHLSGHLNDSGYNGSANVPIRPPLPKEYRTRVNSQDNMFRMRSRNEPIFFRKRSKSISSFPIDDVTYSSDDEGKYIHLSSLRIFPQNSFHQILSDIWLSHSHTFANQADHVRCLTCMYVYTGAN